MLFGPAPPDDTAAATINQQAAGGGCIPDDRSSSACGALSRDCNKWSIEINYFARRQLGDAVATVGLRLTPSTPKMRDATRNRSYRNKGNAERPANWKLCQPHTQCKAEYPEQDCEEWIRP